MSLDRPIYLTGFMGSGKSTVGPRLAVALGVPFVDLDDEIVRRAGKSIPELFATDGEAEFRRHEREALRATKHEQSAVVSVGGGALAEQANLDFALASGTVVYLKATSEALAARLERGRRERPMLRDEVGRRLTGKPLRDRIETLLGARVSHYERAHITVNTGDRAPQDVVSSILRAMAERHQV